MTQSISGAFEGFSVKSGVSKSGKPYKLHTIIVSGKKYGFGFNPPKAAVGDIVEFSAAENDRGYLEAIPETFKSTGRAAPTDSARTNGAAQTSSSGSATNSDPRQASIEMQSSISSASRIVAAQITAGVSISNPAAAVGSLVQSFIDMLHPKAPPKKAAPPPAGPDVGDGDDLPY